MRWSDLSHFNDGSGSYLLQCDPKIDLRGGNDENINKET
jgi:hypothetical protein